MKQIERICEKHNKDKIILTVYSTESGGYTYSLQCAVSRIIRAIFPHQITETYPTPRAAKQAGVETLFAWIKSSRAAKERLRSFDLPLGPYQLEFEFDFS